MTDTKSVQDSARWPDRSGDRPLPNSLVLGVVLFGFWLLWSGHFTPLLLSFGVGSCLFVLFLSRRMNIADEEGAPILLGLRPFSYVPWLIKEVVISNFDVARRVLEPSLPIRPQMLKVKACQKGDLARVIFANSITLTPGTVSVDIQGDQITIHALSDKAAEFDETGEMDRRVTRLEGAR